jgi:ferredoxin
MSKEVFVNENCIWCSACVAICPEVFDLSDEWVAFAKEGVDYEKVQYVDDAISSCPVNAIQYK